MGKKCDRDLCLNTCPKMDGKDKNQCIINKVGNSYETLGCNKLTEYCKYVGDIDGDGNGDYECTPRIKNGQDCDNNM